MIITDGITSDLLTNFYSQEEIEKLTGWKPLTLQRYSKQGKFPSFIRVGGRCYWEKSIVLGFYQALSNNAQKH